MQERNLQPITRSKRRTASEWQTIIDAQSDSGLSKRAYCESEGLSLSTFNHWRRKLNGKTEAARFVELRREAQDQEPSDWQVELALGEHLVLRIRQS